MNGRGLKWVERFQVYVLTVGTLAAGDSVEDLPLPLDSDAPFVLRGRGGRIQNDPLTLQAGMNGLSTRYRDSENNYRSDGPVPWYLECPGNGYGGQWKPVHRPIVYPASGALLFSVFNTGPGAVDLTNLQFYFVGAKRFPPSTPFITYPERIRGPLPFTYSYWSKNPTGLNLPYQNALLPASANIQNIPLTIQSDADFVLRSGQAGIHGVQAAPYWYMELFITLRDALKKPYMNAPVHIDWLFGSGHIAPMVAAATGQPQYYLPNNIVNVFGSSPAPPNQPGFIPGQTPLSGNWHPGLIWPEIYLPANSQMYFDLLRNDSGFTSAPVLGGGTTAVTPPEINLHISWQGAKVFRA